MRLKTEPYPHQAKATQRALEKGNYAFLFEPRCGKSKAALDAISVQASRGEVRRVVIIAPLSVLSVWEDQIREHLSVPAKVKVVGEKVRFVYPGHYKHEGPIQLSIYLINYDKFSRRGDVETYRNAYVRQVERWKPDLIVLDESHRTKSAGSVRSQALWRSVQRQRRDRDDGRPFVNLLTGTPSPKGYIDIFAQFRIMDDTIFGTAKGDFEERYCQYGFGKRRYTIVRYLRKKEILSKIRDHSSVVSAAKAGLAGVESYRQVRVTLPADVRRHYNDLAEHMVAEIQGQVVTAANPGVRRMRLLQITGGFTTDGLQIHRAKLVEARDLFVDLHELGQSVVVYARFIPEVEALEKMCGDLGFHTAAIYGKVKRSDRAEAIRRFSTRGRKEPHALVFQPQAGSLGLDLTAAAEVVWYSLPDSFEQYYQANQRVCGPKQKRPVRYTAIVARGTLDLAVLDTLREKRDIHKQLMRSPREFLYGLSY